MRKALICFTRVPRSGQTKTRLMGLLTPEQCAGLHWAFLKDLARVYRRVDAALFIAHTPDPDWEALKEKFPFAEGFFPQTGDELGARMDHALRKVLAMGYEAVVLTGADLPAMTEDHLHSGFAALEQADISLGPTTDGGYYLIGARKPCPEVFSSQQYGCATVFENTLAAAKSAGLSVGFAAVCGDVDTPEDLKKLQLPPDSATGAYLDQLRKEGAFYD